MHTIRVGTRKSPLAMWQANLVAQKLDENGIKTQIIPIASEGDANLKQPIYKLGITGVFTRALDVALLNDQIDIAVHSLKDVPTILPDEIELISCMERGNSHDILIYKNEDIFLKQSRKIATGSLRRSAIWLNRFPQDTIENLRGNVQLRLQKLQDSDWDGAIFAFAGIERTGILEELEAKGLKYEILDWMTPAPSQGIIGITAKKGIEIPAIGSYESNIASTIERQFLNVLEGGCTAPIGAYAEVVGELVKFSGVILSIDGKEKISIQEQFPIDQYINKGKKLAESCINKGAEKLIQSIKEQINK